MPRYLIYGLGKRWNLCKYLFPDECIAGYTDKAKLGEVMEDGRQVVDFSSELPVKKLLNA